MLPIPLIKHDPSRTKAKRLSWKGRKYTILKRQSKTRKLKRNETQTKRTTTARTLNKFRVKLITVVMLSKRPYRIAWSIPNRTRNMRCLFIIRKKIRWRASQWISSNTSKSLQMKMTIKKLKRTNSNRCGVLPSSSVNRMSKQPNQTSLKMQLPMHHFLNIKLAMRLVLIIHSKI